MEEEESVRGGGAEEERKEVLILFSWPQLWAQPIIQDLVKPPGREEGAKLVKGTGCREDSAYFTRRRAGSSPLAIPDGTPPSPPGTWVHCKENENLKKKKKIPMHIFLQ